MCEAERIIRLNAGDTYLKFRISMNASTQLALLSKSAYVHNNLEPFADVIESISLPFAHDQLTYELSVGFDNRGRDRYDHDAAKQLAARWDGLCDRVAREMSKSGDKVVETVLKPLLTDPEFKRFLKGAQI